MKDPKHISKNDTLAIAREGGGSPFHMFLLGGSIVASNASSRCPVQTISRKRQARSSGGS